MGALRPVIFAVAAAAGVAQGPAANVNQCNVYGPGVTYQASQLYSPTGDWTLQGFNSYETFNYTYTFNICGDVNNVPTACVGQPLAPAYQWTNTSQAQCTYLATSVSRSRLSPQSALFDVNNPAKGMVMTYIGGPGCGNGVSRQFSLVFQCARFSMIPPGTYDFFYIEETNMCQYEAFLWSNAGCPKECPVGPNGALCSDNGICGYDKNIPSARCFCDDDYMDADCSNPRAPFPTGAIAGTTIAGMGAGAIALFGFSYWKTRRGGSTAAVEGFYAQVQ